MEFKRINKDTVTCIITEDDMDEQGIKLEDLFEKKKEAMDFLHEVMRRAEEEVDYKPSGSFMPLQINVLPDHSISLTLTENASATFGDILKNITEKAGIKIPKNVLEDLGDSGEDERIERLNEYLKSLKELTSSVKKMMSDSGSDDNKLSSHSGNNAEIKADQKNEAVNRPERDKKKDAGRLKFHEYIFSFKDLATVIKFCKKVPSTVNIQSSLYKNRANNTYYLDLFRDNEDPKVFASLFTMAYEFGHFQASNPHVIAHIKENYDCIIYLDAIEELAGLAAN